MCLLLSKCSIATNLASIPPLCRAYRKFYYLPQFYRSFFFKNKMYSQKSGFIFAKFLSKSDFFIDLYYCNFGQYLCIINETIHLKSLYFIIYLIHY